MVHAGAISAPGEKNIPKMQRLSMRIVQVRDKAGNQELAL